MSQLFIVCIEFRRGWFDFKSPPLSEKEADAVVDSCREQDIMAYRRTWPQDEDTSERKSTVSPR